MYIIARIVNFIGSIIVALLGLRFVLLLIGANASNQLVNFIYSASLPFVRPFFGIVNYTPSYGSARFEIVTLIALIVYTLATAVLSGLLGNDRRTTSYF